ncbi:hypothetical protein [Anaerobacillus alkalidiazotrophicus]|uniref:hypothetical protein n=1 Tax=Anaerobacillus alkalidiazotrophicus TaxID=472963 RepID=UPI00111468D3|nr:hypothetical protein [Anaerobacillus alkalidiazotrophicus]
MGFIRETGRFLGGAAGFVIGKPIKVIGDVTKIDVVSKIGDEVYYASKFAGDTVGQAVDGAIDTTYGVLQKDAHKRDQGLNNMGDAVIRTGKGVYGTAKKTYVNGKDVYSGIKEGDKERVRHGVQGIATTVAVGAIAVGVVDVIDGVDGAADLATDTAHPLVSGDPGTHFVEPHYVEGYVKANGTEVSGYWRDGDGDTSVNRTVEDGGGYMRSNPDGDPSNNLKG